ncbi:hypothetical protein ANO11243_025940 [Dothideomycetidae sp. 11243]|nr:hypothetical protein ANO11243_025940 [fungal sp. No.11243]
MHGATAIIPNLQIKTWTPEDDTDWWFAGTAVPLLAATLGPAANVLSIAALVTSWRVCLVDGVDPRTCPWNGDPGTLVEELYGHAFHDPRWAFDLNVASLVMGVVGNLFLLFNFTGFVRYKIALPVTIILWYMATGIGFWYGVLAAALYIVAAMLLMLNMVGFFLGHFPEHFNLTDSQRTLILQTMMFFIWLAAGGGIFSKVESLYGQNPQDWSYVNALYFSDVTILTVGFGDLVCTSNLGRGLVFPYSIGGIIMLGLVISSISKFAGELGADKVIQKHQERSRARTFDRVVSSVEELGSRLGRRRSSTPAPPKTISAPFDPVNRAHHTRIAHPEADDSVQSPTKSISSSSTFIRFAAQTTKTLTPRPLRKNNKNHKNHKNHKQKNRLLLLREERDRFNTMRRLEMSTLRYKRWMSFFLSTLCFALLWLIGAVVFYRAERHSQGLSYFDALYFCYVSLLTIGYGDFAPTSNVGRPFFVLWSLIAVPTMTILISSMGNTVIEGFKNGTERIAEFTVLPRMGALRDALERWPFYKRNVDRLKENLESRRREKRIEAGFLVGVEENSRSLHRIRTGDTLMDRDRAEGPDLETLAREAADGEHPLSELQLARRLARAIQQVAQDLRTVPPRRYGYEEWVEFTSLIRFTNYGNRGREPHNRHFNGNDTEAVGDHVDAEAEELIEWDWIGKNSPMMAKQSEAEFVMDRLCESMGRYLRQQAMREEYRAKDTGLGTVETMGTTIPENAPSDEQDPSNEGDTADGDDDEDEDEVERVDTDSVTVENDTNGSGEDVSPTSAISGDTAVERG